MAKSYTDDLLKLLRQDLREVVLTDDLIILMRKSIEEWLQVKERLDKDLKKQYIELQKQESLGRMSKTKGEIDVASWGLRKMVKQRHRVADAHTIEEITEHFKKGYELIHRIREYFTHQDIQYSILYRGRKNQGVIPLHEAHLSLDQVLSQVSLTFMDIKTVNLDTEFSNFINLSITNGAVKKIITTLDKEEALVSTLEDSDFKRELWDSLMDFATIELGDKVNVGYVYEAYRVLRTVPKYERIAYIGHIPGERNTKGLAKALIERATANNDPGWQKGDVAQDQLKAVYRSAANLIQVSSIERVLSDLQGALKSSTGADMTAALTKLFTASDQADFESEFAKQLNKEAAEAIKETLKKADLKIIDKN